MLSPHPRTRARHALAHPAQMAFLSCFAAILFSAPQAHAATCHILESHVPTEAEQAYLKGQYGQAASLYQAQLQQRPDDVNLIAGMAEVLLRQQKVTDAAVLVQKALDQNSSSAVLFTSLGDVQYRQGTPWLASASADKAMKRPLLSSAPPARSQAPAAHLELCQRRAEYRYRPSARSAQPCHPQPLAQYPTPQAAHRRARKLSRERHRRRPRAA